MPFSVTVSVVVPGPTGVTNTFVDSLALNATYCPP